MKKLALTADDSRFNVEVRTTSEPKEMLNMYLAENLYRTWTEDFHDEDSGEIVSINRQERVAAKGVYIDQDLLQLITFHLQAGDIKTVKVISQKRRAEYWCTSRMVPHVVKVNASGIPKRVLLVANDCTSAIECVKDYMELAYIDIDAFSISEVRRLSGCIIIDKVEEGENEDFMSWYQTEVELKYYDAEHDGINARNSKIVYLVFARDVEHSSSKVQVELAESLLNEDSQPDDIIVKKAVPFPCTDVIAKDFCRAYAKG